MKKLFIPLILTSIVNLHANNIDEEKNYLEQIIENTNDFRKNVHESIVDLSFDVDNYFDDRARKIDDYHSSYGLIEISAFQNQHENIQFDQKVKIKLKLPKLKDRFKLVFESDEIRDNVDFVEDHSTKNNSDDFNLALAYDKIFDNKIDFKTKVGIKLKSKIDPFIKIEAKRKWENIKTIDFTVSQALKQSVDKKLESTSYLLLDKQLNEKFSLHNYNELYWKSSERRDSEYYNSIYLNQKINSKNYLTYTIDINTNNIDSNLRIKRYSAKVKYRHYLKKWLYVDTIPENFYKEESDFKPRYAIRFNLGMYFNSDSYK